jgi:hypothetical protein
MFDDLKSVLVKAAWLGFFANSTIAILATVIGYLVAGVAGVYAGLAGTLLAFSFTGLTLLSVYFGAKLKIGGLLGLVLGGWVLKIIIFLSLFSYLNKADWMVGAARPVVFFTVVVAVLAGLILDTWSVNKARIAPKVNLP